MNNDGYDDIIISMDQGGQLYLGGSNPDTVHDVLFDELQDAGLGTGPTVGSAGDLNNDGYDDVILIGNIGIVKAFICYGGETIDKVPDVVIPIWREMPYNGFIYSGLGDMNSDSYDDIMLGINIQFGLDTGKVRIFCGGSSMDSIAEFSLKGEYGKTFGNSLAGGGDFDGDGNNDLLIGDHGKIATLTKQDDAGSVSLFYGGTTLSDTANAVFSGVGSGGGFGSAVTGAGDVNKDGFTDLIIGEFQYWDEKYYKYSGRAHLYLGSEYGSEKADIVFNSENPDGNVFFGNDMGSAGDLNGDNFDDFYIGEKTMSTSRKKEKHPFSSGVILLTMLPMFHFRRLHTVKVLHL